MELLVRVSILSKTGRIKQLVFGLEDQNLLNDKKKQSKLLITFYKKGTIFKLLIS